MTRNNTLVPRNSSNPAPPKQANASRYRTHINPISNPESGTTVGDDDGPNTSVGLTSAITPIKKHPPRNTRKTAASRIAAPAHARRAETADSVSRTPGQLFADFCAAVSVADQRVATLFSELHEEVTSEATG